MVDQDPLTYGNRMQSSLAGGLVVPASADISKRFRFYAQQRFLHYFKNLLVLIWHE